jgi:ribosomal protein S27E
VNLNKLFNGKKGLEAMKLVIAHLIENNITLYQDDVDYIDFICSECGKKKMTMCGDHLCCDCKKDTIPETKESVETSKTDKDDGDWMKVCPQCDRGTVRYDSNRAILQCIKCGWKASLKRERTPEDKEKELAALRKLIDLENSRS